MYWGQVTAFNTINMDEKNARLWTKLEWKALKKAIETKGSEQEVAIRDALIFDNSQKVLYQQYIPDEIRFINNEGLATFTYLFLTKNSWDDYLKRLFEKLNQIYTMPSFSRSFGEIHGAMYATLLYQKGFDFKTIRSDTVDLSNLVKKAYNIELPEVCRDVAGSLALNYDIEVIQSEEKIRVEEIKKWIDSQIGIFIDKPIVFLELTSPYFDFEAEDVHPMDTLGTLYSRMRVADDWGKLTVDKGGCLVSNNYKTIRLSAKGYKSDKNKITGDGWQILLNNDWEIVPLDQNFIIRKQNLR